MEKESELFQLVNELVKYMVIPEEDGKPMRVVTEQTGEAYGEEHDGITEYFFFGSPVEDSTGAENAKYWMEVRSEELVKDIAGDSILFGKSGKSLVLNRLGGETLSAFVSRLKTDILKQYPTIKFSTEQPSVRLPTVEF